MANTKAFGRAKPFQWMNILEPKGINLGFFASHSGSGMKVVVDAIRTGTLSAKPKVLISNNADADALSFATRNGFAALHMSQTSLGVDKDLDTELLQVLKSHGVEIIVLSGYLRKLGPKVLDHFDRPILNVHPTLLPKFGGKGMHGKHAHRAVLKAGETESGATVHYVDAAYDCGDIICQKTVPVRRNDTPDTLADRVASIEGDLLIRALKRVTNDPDRA